MFAFALLIGKLLHFVGSFFGKSSNLPGDIALRLCPGLFKRFRFDGQVLAVTGSNGKTTTANLIAHILKQAGHSVVNNAKGSNLIGGVATTLLTASTLSGRIRQDFVVLEVDERFSRLIFRDFSPNMMLVTNLFRDQLTRNGNVDVILDKLTEAIKPGVKLIVNANDPIACTLAPDNPHCYYAAARTKYSTEQCTNLTNDAKVCPKCFTPLKYNFYHYNHVGDFACPKCGYQTPKAAYVADDVSVEEGRFKICGREVSTDYRNLFFVLNAAGAAAICCEAGVPLDDVIRGLNSFVIPKNRFRSFDADGRPGKMLLSKNQNPVSFDQSITYVLEQPGEKTLIIYVNNINHTHNRDTTWLYDISFERLRGKVENVICTGPRAFDLAVRLDLAGLDRESLRIVPDVRRLGSVMPSTKGDVYVLTEIYDAKSILEVIAK